MPAIVKKEKTYQGTSPDEITLVKFANQCGYEFRSSSDHHAKLRIPHLIEATANAEAADCGSILHPQNQSSLVMNTFEDHDATQAITNNNQNS